MAKPLSRQKTAQLYFALGHPRRLRIIEALQSRPKGVTLEDLEILARIPHSSLCHHIRFLKEAGLLTRQVRDRFSIYALNRHLLDGMVGPMMISASSAKAA